MIRRVLLLLAVLILLPAAALGQEEEGEAEDGSPQAEALLRQAEQAYDQMEYDTALKVLIQAQQTQGISETQKATAYLYMGICFTATGKAEDAVQAFLSMLKLKPDFRLPDTISPSIQEMFKEALDRLKLPQKPPAGPEGAGPQPAPGSEAPPPGEEADPAGQPPDSPGQEAPDQAPAPGPGSPVSVKVKNPARVTSGRPIEVSLELSDPQGLAGLIIVRWRMIGGADFSDVKTAPKSGQKTYRVSLPAITLPSEDRDATGKVVYFVGVLGPDGTPLVVEGSMDSPYTVQVVQPPEPKSNLKWWLVGVGAGLVVVGGVVAAALLIKPSNDGPLPDTVGATVILR